MVFFTSVGTIVRIVFCLVMLALVAGLTVGNQYSGSSAPSPSVSRVDQTRVVRTDDRKEVTEPCKLISCSV